LGTGNWVQNSENQCKRLLKVPNPEPRTLNPLPFVATVRVNQKDSPLPTPIDNPAARLGLLNLNKLPGMTSRDAVNCVQRLVRPLKAGHAGTLDPLASGVLVVCVGAATRLIEYVQRMTKHYSGTFLLGRQSPTEDVEGEVTELENPPIPTLDQLTAAATRLTGTIQQRPPAYSALKVAGRRAYDLARQGKTVELAPRSVVVYRLEVESYVYPELKLRVECGSGTYIRSLGRDLAESLGTAAVMSGLVRTAIGSFRLAEAIDPTSLDRENWTGHLLPALQAVETLPHMTLDSAELARVRLGQPIERSDVPTGKMPSHQTDGRPIEIAALDPAGQLVAILKPRGPGFWGPILNLPDNGEPQP
jgi:tRNA pseudouridine55 synthase